MINLLKHTVLFQGIGDGDIAQLLHCLSPEERRYGEGELLLREGDESRSIGVVLDGEIEAVQSTLGGGEVVITHMGPGGIFADVLSGSHRQSPVTVRARTGVSVLWMPHLRLVSPCERNHAAHGKLLRNLIGAISDKYFLLYRRIELLTMRSLRGKIAAYLLEQAANSGKNTFFLQMTRQGLAQYLNCERSALSRELSRMQREGILSVYRNSFKVDVARLTEVVDRL